MSYTKQNGPGFTLDTYFQVKVNKNFHFKKMKYQKVWLEVESALILCLKIVS